MSGTTYHHAEMAVTLAPNAAEQPTSLSAFLQQATSALSAAGLGEALREARWLVREVLRLDETDLMLRENVLLSQGERARLRDALRRRAAREPLPYIVGSTQFLNWRFSITPAVLVPRPETEIWVEAVAQRLSRLDLRGLTAVDVGCGSGVIGTSLCLLGAAARALLLDISWDAVALARDNATALGLGRRVLVARADLLRAVRPSAPYALVANLPYVERGVIDSLEPEIRLWEPRQALDGGEDGLAAIGRLLEQVAALPTPPRLMALEVGAGQGAEVEALVRRIGVWESLEWVRDYGGVQRAVIAYAHN